MFYYTFFIQSLRRYSSFYTCRESLSSTYTYIVRNKPELVSSDKFIYFGHLECSQEVIDKYLPACKLVWGDRVVYDLVDLDKVKNKYAKDSLADEGYYSTNTTLVRVKGMVNPFDISLILYLSYKDQYAIEYNNYTNMYFIAKKYTDLIPDTFYGYRSNFWANGPSSYISGLRQYEPEEYNTITKLYLEHKDEVNI
jgi:hypothetical protein